MPRGLTGEDGAAHVLLTTDAIGGVWRYTSTLASGFAARGLRCTIAVLGPAAEPRQSEQLRNTPGVQLIETGLPLDWTVTTSAELADIARSLADLAGRLEVDSIHLHAPPLAACAWPAPVVAVMHSCLATWWDSMRDETMPAHFVRITEHAERGLHAADAVIAPSYSFAAALRRNYACARPVEIVLNGLAPRASAEPARENFVMAAGRLWDEAKDAAVLDAAAAIIATPVWAAGPVTGPNGASFQPCSMTWAGNLPPAALHELQDRAAIFTSAARYEPFGLAVLEAAQGGAPLVLSDIPTHRELWDGAAVFVRPGDPMAYAAAWATLLDDPAERAALGLRARARASCYNANRMVAETAAIHGAAFSVAA